VILDRRKFEPWVVRVPRGAASRVRLFFYRLLGMKQGRRNRMEGKGRCRRVSQISIGDFNSFTQGCWLWPNDEDFDGVRIRIGDGNYFNRNLMIDACNYVEIGNNNMFGPDVYVADSNHGFRAGVSPKSLPMQKGKVKIGSNCWIGAKAIILKDVDLGDACVVGAGAVVTKSFPAGSVIAGVPAQLLERS
jgi:acetyltransferase-like isoleucine patch superfamily enzyme